MSPLGHSPKQRLSSSYPDTITKCFKGSGQSREYRCVTVHLYLLRYGRGVARRIYCFTCGLSAGVETLLGKGLGEDTREYGEGGGKREEGEREWKGER